MSGETFHCPGCNAQLLWTPGAQTLSCPHCGHVETHAPTEQGAPVIQEYRLDEAALKAARGWGVEKKSVQCKVCGAIAEVEPQVSTQACPFCDSAQLVEQADDPNVIQPESLVPFVISRDDAGRRFRTWLKGLWFRPGSLKSTAQIESLDGVYIPAWTFDARTASQWWAEAGHHYYVEETRTVTENGKQVEKRERVRKTRWEPASGWHQGAYDDWIVQASTGLGPSDLKGLLPFDLKALQPYNFKYLQGFKAERYQVDLEKAWDLGQKEIGADVRQACSKLVPGDEQRNLRVDTKFHDVTFKHLLLPVWISAYRYNGKVFRYLVNGQTGKAFGSAPYSVVKIVGFIFGILVAIGLIAACLGILQS